MKPVELPVLMQVKGKEPRVDESERYLERGVTTSETSDTVFFPIPLSFLP